MKKYLKTLFAVLLVCMVLPTLTVSASHSYDWDSGSSYEDDCKTNGHSWTSWEIIKKATVFKKGIKERECYNCFDTQRAEIAKVKPKVTLSHKKLTLTAGKSTSKLKVKKMSNGDKVAAWTSSNKKIAIVNRKTGKIVAKGKGTTYITVKMKSGIKARCKVVVKVPTVAVTTPVATSYVWISATGTKYHIINNCGNMNPNKATRITKTEAQSRGFGACSKCF